MTNSAATINFGLGYGVIRYPAGEMQVRFSEQQTYFRNCEPINIIARVVSGEEIMQLALLVDAVRHASREVNVAGGGPTINLIMPYLPYGRADRRFVPGDCLGLGVFASIVGSMHVAKVITLDVHNENAAKTMFPVEFVNVGAMALIQRAIMHYASATSSDKVTVLFPDQGAAERYAVPHTIHVHQHPIDVHRVYGRKTRNAATGRLEGFELQANLPDGPLLIVDDICDGGGTFLMCAEELHKRGLREMALYTTHSMYSMGLAPLFNKFSRLYTTNSFPWAEINHVCAHARVMVFDAEAELLPHAQ